METNMAMDTAMATMARTALVFLRAMFRTALLAIPN
jgi:hypothetical protein